MAVNVGCRCGQRLKLKPELAGKKVKCPKCGSVLRVPAEIATGAETAGAEKVAASKAGASAGRSAEGAAAASSGTPATAGSAGNNRGGAAAASQAAAASTQTRPCPSCRGEMTAEQVVCPHCSYSLRLKKRMRSTQVSTSAVSPGAKEREAKAKIRAKQKPARNLALIVGLLVALVLGPLLLFGIGLLLGPEDTFKLTSVLGTVLAFGGGFWIRLLTVAENESAMVMLNPVGIFYSFAFMLRNPGECIGPFLLIGLGIAVHIVGFFFALGIAAVTGVH